MVKGGEEPNCSSPLLFEPPWECYTPWCPPNHGPCCNVHWGNLGLPGWDVLHITKEVGGTGQRSYGEWLEVIPGGR